ncbi:MAG: hypothetical protein IPK63_09570 [Candidatus Competibacteraceae bacterium]|nr:hypothetical protein [Candidatus Competibacteraceae bacterium]
MSAFIFCRAVVVQSHYKTALNSERWQINSKKKSHYEQWLIIRYCLLQCAVIHLKKALLRVRSQVQFLFGAPFNSVHKTFASASDRAGPRSALETTSDRQIINEPGATEPSRRQNSQVSVAGGGGCKSSARRISK